MTVYLVIFDRASYQISTKLFSDLAAYIDQNYVDQHTDSFLEQLRYSQVREKAARAPMAAPMPQTEIGLEQALSRLDEGFSQTLLQKIDESGMTDAQCYKKANIDRKLFSKIRSNPAYRPSKPTALAFAVALELSLEETDELLRRAGLALSHANKFDIIVEIGRAHV